MRLPPAEKLDAAEGQMSHSGRVGRFTAGPPGDKKAGGAEQQLAKICCDANKVALEQIKGISGQARTSMRKGRKCDYMSHIANGCCASPTQQQRMAEGAQMTDGQAFAQYGEGSKMLTVYFCADCQRPAVQPRHSAPS